MSSLKRRSFASAWRELKANDGGTQSCDLDEPGEDVQGLSAIEGVSPAASSSKRPLHAEAQPEANPEDQEQKAKHQCTAAIAAQPAVQTKMSAFLAAPTSHSQKAPSSRARPSPYALQHEGFKAVPGFEPVGLEVAARVNKKLPKTQSWCFVPLIYSALQQVPQHLRTDGISTVEQIATAQEVWRQLFSHWQRWCEELAQAIDKYGQQRFEDRFLPKGISSAKSWTTSLVYGEPRTYGRLPHPHGRNQDAVLSLLACDTQNQIFASVMAITSQSV